MEIKLHEVIKIAQKICERHEDAADIQSLLKTKFGFKDEEWLTNLLKNLTKTEMVTCMLWEFTKSATKAEFRKALQDLGYSNLDQ